MQKPIKSDAGDLALEPHLEPGEVLITNLRQDGFRRNKTRQVLRSKEGRGMTERYEGEEIIPVHQYVAQLRQGGRYESVRVIQMAFDTSGNRIPNNVAIVGKRKPA